jgi:tetratricopeptide (TPR) repeat protein
VSIFEATLAPNHPDLATGLNNLALALHFQGKYTQAEPLFKRALNIWEKALPPDHPSIAQGLENYATLLRKTNRPVEAEKMEARAKAIRAKRPAQNPPK